LIGLFRAGKIDAITFSSPSTVDNFAALIGQDNLSTLLKDTTVACIGPVTAAAALSHGITAIVQPAVYTAPALVSALIAALID
jgi:uroporphyrinogen III methyltransferase/synthase